MTDRMADIVGLAGSALFIAGFLYSNIAKSMNFVLFNAVNLIGAVLLIASLTVHYNLAAMALEICWALIAGFGLVKALAGRRGR